MNDELKALREQVENHTPQTLATGEDWRLLAKYAIAIHDEINNIIGDAEESAPPTEEQLPAE